MNEETVTVTIVFDNNEKRSRWLKDTITRDFPQHSETVEMISSQPMEKNITLKLEPSERDLIAEKQKDIQLQLPFGKPLNCS